MAHFNFFSSELLISWFYCLFYLIHFISLLLSVSVSNFYSVKRYFTFHANIYIKHYLNSNLNDLSLILTSSSALFCWEDVYMKKHWKQEPLIHPLIKNIPTRHGCRGQLKNPAHHRQLTVKGKQEPIWWRVGKRSKGEGNLRNRGERTGWRIWRIAGQKDRQVMGGEVGADVWTFRSTWAIWTTRAPAWVSCTNQCMKEARQGKS